MLATTVAMFGVVTALPVAVAASVPPAVGVQLAWSTGANRGLLTIDARAERFVVGGDDEAASWAAFGPGGAFVVASGTGFPPRLWDVGTGDLLSELDTADGATVVFSTDGTDPATSDGHLDETASGREIGVLRSDGTVAPVAFSPRGGLIAGLGSQRGTVVLWE